MTLNFIKHNTAYASYRSASTTAFNPQEYMPEPKFATQRIRDMLKTSILKNVPEAEAAARIELAAAYRLFEVSGWNENIYNHLSAKVVEPNGEHSFLINPFGLKYGEITASSLVKVSYDGTIKDPGVTGDTFGINEAGFVIHSAIHRARPELKSVMHCHHPPAAGISAVNQGYLELTQTFHQCGPMSYHDYNGIVVDMDEQKSLVEDIGDKKILILRNHGVITAGENIGEAWYIMYQLMKASEIQVSASACALGDKKNLKLPPEAFVEKTFEVVHGKGFSGAKYGVKEISAYMRWLDSVDPSYRT